MKYTVLLLLLVDIILAEPLRGRHEGRKSSRRSERKGELLEGNYGLRIRPIDNVVQLTEDYSRSRQQKNTPSQEYGPPRAPHRGYGVLKVSDVLSTQGRAVPAAIANHLYSPVSAYQPRFRFEISKPVPSQMLYSEQIISDAFLSNHGFGPLQQLQPPLITATQQEKYDRKEFLQNRDQKYNPSPLDAQILVNEDESYEKQENLSRNFESQKTYKISEFTGQSNGAADQAQRTQQEKLRNLQNFESVQQAQLNLEPQTVPTYHELQPTRVDLLHPFLSRVLPYNHPSQAIYSHQLLQPIYPTEIQGFPPNFFHQINQLGNQLTVKIENIEHADNEKTNEEEETKDSEKELKEDLNQSPERIDEQTSVIQAEVTSISPIPSPQPQAVSYSRFFLGLQQPPSNENQLPLHVPLSSPTPPPQIQPLPQPQPPHLFVTSVSPQLIEQSTPRPILQPIPQQFKSQQELFLETTPQPTFQPLIQPLQPLQKILQPTLQPVLQSNQFRLQPIQPQLQIIQQTTPQPTLQPRPQLFQPTTQQPTLQPQLQPIQPLLQSVQPQLQIIQSTTQQPTLQPQLQSIQPQFQPLPPQQTVQPATSVAPPKKLFTVANQPRSRGIIRFRQRPTTLSLRLNQQTMTTSFRNQTTSTTSSQGQPTLSTQEPVFSSTPLVVTTLNSQPLFTSQEFNNFSDNVSTVAQTESPTSSALVSIVPKFVSTLSTPSTTTPSTLPPQRKTETSILTSQSSHQTLSTRNIDSQPVPTLPSLPSPESQSIKLSPEPQILSTLQPNQVLTSLEPLPTPQPFPVPQPLSLQPVQIRPQPEIPGIRAIPVQSYVIPPAQPIQLQSLTSQRPIQLQPVDQRSAPVQNFEIKPLSVQIPLQVTSSPPPLEIQFATQLQVDQQQQQQSQLQQSQLQQQSQSNHQSQLQQQPLTQKQQESQSQSDKTEKNLVNLLQDDKEARIIHAHELLYQLYSPYLQQTVYPQAPEVLIQLPRFKAPLAIPPPYPTPLQATPAFSTQYFGKYAHDIFGGQSFPHYKKK